MAKIPLTFACGLYDRMHCRVYRAKRKVSARIATADSGRAERGVDRIRRRSIIFREQVRVHLQRDRGR